MRRRTVSRDECLRILRKALPKGWTLVEREAEEGAPKAPQFRDKTVGWVAGVCNYETRVLECLVVECRCTLLVALHEIGHAVLHSQLLDGDHWYHPATIEHEAEQFAIDTMRGLGIAVRKKDLQVGKRLIRELCTQPGASDEALKFAYGKEWREHR